jgi:hypothetical protein
MQVVASAADLAIGMLSTATFGRARAQLFSHLPIASALNLHLKGGLVR